MNYLPRMEVPHVHHTLPTYIHTYILIHPFKGELHTSRHIPYLISHISYTVPLRRDPLGGLYLYPNMVVYSPSRHTGFQTSRT